MKRIIAISFLFLYLFTATGFDQLWKLPVLVEHFTEHKEANRELGFFTFLYMHYAGDDNNDKDQDRDMKLPFKSFENCNIASFMPVQHQAVSFSSIEVDQKNKVEYQGPAFQSDYLSCIWQPPESC